ncbi:MAG: hypothetical protein J6U54_03610 [Clostridiales bacterium]|nr:hypothetical protein [Clostridiales bacterium]
MKAYVIVKDGAVLIDKGIFARRYDASVAVGELATEFVDKNSYIKPTVDYDFEGGIALVMVDGKIKTIFNVVESEVKGKLA